MKIIPVKLRNKNASIPMLVDDEDYDRLNKRKWFTTGYETNRPRAKFNNKNLSPGRILMNFPKRKLVDHIDRNPLNNQRENLRLVSKQQNNWNSKARETNSARFKGVSWHKRRKKWYAAIGFNHKVKHLGVFDSEIEAAKAYNKAAKKTYGKYAFLNEI